MELRNIDHIVLVTSDLEKTLAFYEGLLGMQHLSDGKRHALAFGSCKINLHTVPHEFAPSARNPALGSADLCLITSEDIRAVKAELEGKGATITEGVVLRNGARGKMNSIYLYDPDGNLVEIAQYIESDQ